MLLFFAVASNTETHFEDTIPSDQDQEETYDTILQKVFEIPTI
jgi:hypothetical protein